MELKQATKAFTSLKAEQQRSLKRYNPRLFDMLLQNMSYREWRQYKCKQRSSGKDVQ